MNTASPRVDPPGGSTENIGEDLKVSLLMLFKGMKNQCYIPDFFRKLFIKSIPKKRMRHTYKQRSDGWTNAASPRVDPPGGSTENII